MEKHKIKIIYSKRKSISIRVDDNEKVIIRSPKNISKKELENFIADNSSWIKSRLKERSIQKNKRNELLKGIDDLEQKKKEAKGLIMESADRWSKKLNIKYKKVRISNARKRWGSCSSKGSVSINWRLVFAPKDIMDYVIVHELLHLKHMNHSKSYWKSVEEVIPDYKKRRKWLKANEYLLKV